MAGSIFTGDVIKSQLEDANRNYYGQRTWAKLFGDLDLSKQLGTENLIKNYGNLVGEAYLASKANERSILGSNAFEGFKQAALDENQLTLEKAYDSYMSQYLSDQQALNKGIAQERATLNQELDTLAQRTADYGNAHFDYLQALWDKHQAGELNFNPFEQPQFAQYLTKEKDADGNEIQVFDIDKIQAGLFDENDTLNQRGIDFFDMIEHDDILNENYSFADYLQENDKELYEWGRSENPYNFAPNKKGLNLNDATFRQMVGQSPLDEQYNYLERAYGMKDGEIKNLFGDLETKSAELIESLNAKGALFMRDSYRIDDREIKELSNSYVEGLNKIAADMGLTNELKAIAVNAGYDTIEGYVNQLVLDYVNTVKEGWGFNVTHLTEVGAKEATNLMSKYRNRVKVSKDKSTEALNSILSELINYAQGKNN